MAVTTSASNSKDVSVAIKGGSKNEILDYSEDIKHCLQTDEKAMASVKKYAFFKNISIEEAILNMVKMILACDRCKSSPFYQASLKMDKINLLEDYSLSPYQRCISLNIGPIKISLCITFGILKTISPMPLTVELKAFIGNEVIIDTKIDTSLGNTVTVNGNIGIANITLKMTFGVDGRGYYIIFDVFGEVGIKIFNTKFGPIIKRVNLGWIIKNGLNDNDDIKENNYNDNNLFETSKLFGISGKLDTSKALILYILEHQIIPNDINKVIKFSTKNKDLKYVSFVECNELLVILLESGIEYVDSELGNKPKIKLLLNNNDMKTLDQYLNALKHKRKLSNTTEFFDSFDNPKLAKQFANVHVHSVKNFFTKQQPKTDMAMVQATSGSGNSDVNALIEKLLNGAVGTLNSIIPNAIRSAHLDPYENVWSKSGSKEIGSGIFKFGASYNASVSHIVGLSQIEINNNGFSNVNVNVDSNGNYSGSTNINIHIGGNGNITMNVNGGASVVIFGKHIGPSISGSVKCSGVSASANATISGNVNLSQLKASLDHVSLSNLNINVSNVDVTINGLPSVLSSLLDPIIDMIINLVKGEIIGALESPIQNAINDAIKSALPIST